MTAEIPEAPGPIMQRMGQIERRLGVLDTEWGSAARQERTTKWEYEREKARVGMLFAGRAKNQEVLKALVVDHLWAENEDLMNRLMQAEAAIAGCAAEYKTLDRELSSLQTRLQVLARMESIPAVQR